MFKFLTISIGTAQWNCKILTDNVSRGRDRMDKVTRESEIDIKRCSTFFQTRSVDRKLLSKPVLHCKSQGQREEMCCDVLSVFVILVYQ